MAGTMGRLSVGVSGLQTSQYAINTTAHNLMNTQTDGYSRQQVILTDLMYNKVARDNSRTYKAGLGVVTAELKQARDNFADVAYREEYGRLNYYKAQYETVEEVEGYFGETEGEDFNSTLDAFWHALQELQKESNSIVTRSSFISTAQSFLDRVQGIRRSLVNYQRNLNGEIQKHVDRINELSKTILELNGNILMAEAAGIENANDYRDARNMAIDELSSIVSTEIVPNKDGTVEVYIEGRILVTGGKTYQLASMKVIDHEKYEQQFDFTGDATDFEMPVWADDEDPLFDIKKLPSTETDTDIGALKGLLMSRGYFISDYTDLPVKPTKPLADDFANDADYQAALADYETASTEYVQKVEYYNKYVEPYTITNLSAQFDTLVHAIMVGMNDILCPNKEVTLADGTTIKILDEEAAGIGMGNGNEYAGTELFVRGTMPRYTTQTITLADGTSIQAQVYNEENPDDYYSLYTTGTVSVNIELAQTPSLLPLSRVSGEEAQTVADKLLDLWNSKFAPVSPNSLVDCNFKDFYAGMIGELSDRGYMYKGMVETQQQTVVDIDIYRQEVAGVSSDEELSNLIKFQHAYNAASRYINTVSEMIEHLIERLGA
ncbi:MAG: flagellar hook-associated protein FlgK [Clostridium sp.]|nr:flagellar hook-associated protein FlgK [Clostridium sp.]MCM1171664.1 flagellar hook-associated protein FlgK [Clostridium sp.]MCM1207812.1 flagellar hook-associated protein FlgK [Ruminococcus sp.]